MSEENHSHSHSHANVPVSYGNNIGMQLFLGIVVAGGLIAAAIMYTGGAFSKNKAPGPVPTVNGNQGQEQGSQVAGATQKDKRITLAEKIGLDKSKYSACLDKNDKTEVNNDVETLTKAFVEYNKGLKNPNDGLGGTPTFIIGKVVDGNMIEGQAIVGALPFDVFDKVLDSWVNKGVRANVEGVTVENNIKISLDDDPVKGNKDAKIAMLEISDYECPFCKRYFDQTYPEVVKKYVDNGKVKIVFRDFPLPGHNPTATDVAIAVNCARELGGDNKYYEYHDLYFKNTLTNGKGL